MLVLRALSRMPERQRTILVMHDLDELSMPEIAGLLQVPLFTGYSRLRLARQSFARAVRSLKLQVRVSASASLSATALLDAERAPPPVPEVVRQRAVSRVRALLAPAATAAPRPRAESPRPSPTSRPALATAALVGLVAVSLGNGTGASGLKSPPPVTTSASPLARGLVGYWRFDDGPGSTVTRDRSGSGNDCVLRSSGSASTSGLAAGALILDGHGWLECARAAPLAKLDRELTIGLWVKPTSLRGRQVFVSRQLGGGREDYFLLGLLEDTLEVQGHLWQSATHRPLRRPAGQWFHVAAVQRQDGVRTLYLDGVEIGHSTRSRPVALGGGTSLLTIGGDVNGADPRLADQRFAGAMDELVLYDRALSPQEIRALAARTQPLP
jgi:hypothetical protein